MKATITNTIEVTDDSGTVNISKTQSIINSKVTADADAADFSINNAIKSVIELPNANTFDKKIFADLFPDLDKTKVCGLSVFCQQASFENNVNPEAVRFTLKDALDEELFKASKFEIMNIADFSDIDFGITGITVAADTYVNLFINIFTTE